MILVLEGHELQLEKSTISQTFQVNDLADLKDRQSGHSNTIKVPRSPHNERVMRLLGVRSGSDIHTKKIPAKIISNGIEIVANGYAVISASLAKHYNISVYDGVIKLSDELGDKTFKDLDYSDINHFVNMAEFQAGMQRTTGYVNAIAEFGDGMTIEHLPASVYVNSIWDKIFRGANFTYSGDIFEDEKFKSLVIPPAQGYDTSSVDSSTVELGEVDSFANSIEVNKTGNYIEVEKNYIFKQKNLGDIVADEDLLIKNEGIYAFNIQVSGLDTYNNKDLFVSAHLNVNGVSKAYFGKENSTKKVVLFLKKNDRVSSLLSLSYYPHSNTEEFHEIYIESNVEVVISKQTGGLFINYSDIMPELSQKAFVKDIMQRFGLIMRPNKFNNRHYEFIQIEKLLNDRASAEDWSDKYVSHTENYEVGSYARENLFKYQYDKEELNEGFADGIMKIDNDTVQETKEAVSSPFLASKSSYRKNGISIYEIPNWGTKDDKLEIQKTDVRLFSVVRHDTAIEVKQKSVTNYTAISSNIPFLDFTPCYYQKFVDDNYKAFNYLLNKGKKIKAIMRLNAVDVYNIDFFKLKYIEQLGAYFYLNKISNFKGQNTVQVELIEIGDIVFNAPPISVGDIEKTVKQKSSYVFSWEEFTRDYYDREGDEAVAIKFKEIPSNISFKLNNKEITTSTEITKQDVMLGRFKIEVPASENGYTRTALFVLKDSGSGFFSTDTGRLTVNITGRENTPPEVNAGVDINTKPNSTIQLNAIATDDVSVSSVKWTQISGSSVTIINDTQLNASTTLTEEGVYVFRLTATDSDGTTAYDDVTVRCYEKLTNITYTKDYENNYTVKITGNAGAVINLTASTSEEVGAWVKDFNISKNTAKSFSVSLNESGEASFKATLFVGDGDAGSLSIIIKNISEGIIGNDEIILFGTGNGEPAR